MFKKKKCKNCGNKINDNYEFCPSCGIRISKSSNEDWGMLGKDDFPENDISERDIFSAGFFGNITVSMLGKMFNNAMRMLEKEMQKEFKQSSKNQRNFFPRTNLRLMINGQEINLNNQNNLKKPLKKKPLKEIPQKDLPKGNLKNFAKLEKIEPVTNIRRFSDKIIYEIQMPGVKSSKDLSITKLEKSIEIKGLAKNKAYQKIIPINLPITNYEFSKETLVLELGTRN